MRRFTVLTFIGVVTTIIFFGLAALYGWNMYVSARRPADIRLVVSSWPTSRLFFATKELGFFERRGVHVELIDVGNKYSQTVETVLQGDADGGAFVLSEPLLMTAAGTPMKVVLNTDYSSGADGIVAGNQISSIADLRGKKVAHEPEGFGDLLLENALARSGLSATDIVTVPLTAQDGAHAFLNREVDAVVTLEPFLSQAKSRGDSHVIFTSAQAPGLLPDVVAFRADFLAAHQDDVRAFVSAWFDMVNYLNTSPANRQEILAVAAIKNGGSLTDIEAQFSGIHLFTFADNAASFTYGTETTSLFGSARRFVDFFLEKERLESPLDLETIIDPRFIRSGLR